MMRPWLPVESALAPAGLRCAHPRGISAPHAGRGACLPLRRPLPCRRHLAATAHDNVRWFRRSCVTCPGNLPETFLAPYLRQSAAVGSTRPAPAEFDCAVSSVVLRWAYLRTCLAGYLPKARD